MKVIVLHDGFRELRDEALREAVADTVRTANDIKEALGNRGHHADTFEVTRNNFRQVGGMSADVFINFVDDEGAYLLDRVSRTLERHKMTVVGADRRFLLDSVDKPLMKLKLKLLGIRIPEYAVVSSVDTPISLEYPLIVKPARQHASVGITVDSVAEDRRQLTRILDRVVGEFGEVMVEEYIVGQEIHVTVVGNGDPIVLPPAEVTFGREFDNRWKIFSYNGKWEAGTWEYAATGIKCPADLTQEVKDRVESVALSVFKGLGARDYIRFDMRVDEHGRVYTLDVNTNPGLTYSEEDATCASARAWGWSYDDLIENIVLSARSRVTQRQKQA